MSRLAIAILFINATNFCCTIALPAIALNVTDDDVEDSDIILTSEGGRSRSISKGTVLWDKVVPYFIDPNMPKRRQHLFELAVLQFNKHHKCVHFIKKRPEDTNYVHVKSGRGCTSPLGNRTKVQTLTLAEGCGLSDTMHEMMHTLGFMHEHQRADSGKYLNFHTQNLQHKSQASQVSNLLEIKKNWRKYLPYDYSSLMHYSANAFAKPETKTITVRHFNKSIEDSMGHQLGFSSCDIYKMNFVYGCKQYTDRDRTILCKLHNRRGVMLCPRRDRYRYCQRAAKDENLCWRQPGLFQINCPVACGNCEGLCYNSPYENEFCQYIVNNREQGYKCRLEDQHKCPRACGIC